jgi:hypothetical protein
MTKLFRDVDYFITQASNSTQREFELDFADIIEVFDTNETTITTECGRTVIITWQDNYFKSYHVIYETAQMESAIVRHKVQHIISLLNNLTLNGDSVDGETMQYILQKVGMEDQMLRQLVMSQPIEEVRYMIEEREEFEEELDNQI